MLRDHQSAFTILPRPRLKPLLYRLRLLWLCAVLLLIAVALFPVSNRMTRLATVLLAGVVWFGAIPLFWRHTALRIAVITLTAVCGALFLLPTRGVPATEALRADNVAALQRYDGARYVWGGENRLGIDCSGLVRRGMIDGLLARGVLQFDPGLVRQALSLWWNDCTAAALGRGDASLTRPVLETESINALDHSRILPGDLAVTKSGLHVLAYLGENTWLEADPLAMRVIRVTAPSADNVWLQGPVRIVRWRFLDAPLGVVSL